MATQAAMPAELEEPFLVAVAVTAERRDSLDEFLLGLPADLDAPIVLVVRHREVMGDEDALFAFIRERTHYEPARIERRARPSPGTIHIAPAGRILTLSKGAFVLRTAKQAVGHRGTIDSFFLSLASDRGERTIAVVLQDTAGDGTAGVAAIKEAGGLTIAERNPHATEAMLSSGTSPAAIADSILDAGEIGQRIVIHVRHATKRGERRDMDRLVEETSASVAHITTVLRNKTGHDFHGYKPATLLRRVQRRMQVVQVDSFEDYINILQASADEPRHLFNDLLIGVTRFFRDQAEFEALEREVIPRLLQGKGAGDQVRVWVLGCATGEEAYSIAILLREAAARMDAVPAIQVFATDIDGRALTAARVGRYPDTIAADVAPERLARWFVREGDTYCVTKELREMCIFSAHNLIKDAPFSRLSLISCRNLLIYLTGEMQERVIPLFHFALQRGGYLFLGNSENVTRHPKLFSAVDRPARIFQRLETTARILPDFPLMAGEIRRIDGAQPPVRRRSHGSDGGLLRRAEQVAARFMPAMMIVDEHQEVLHFSGRTGRFLEPSSGAASLDVLNLVHRDLRLDLRSALQRSIQTNEASRVTGVQLNGTEQPVRVDLIVEPVRDLPDVMRSFVVLFKDGHAEPDGVDGNAASSDLVRDEQARRLEQELRETRDRLQTTVEELETANEELKSANEEYQSLNEELQSANEELETSKEELQSVNEELTTVNGELAHRVQELTRTTSDLKNFLENTRIPTIFLDNELKVMNYTPAVSEIFHLVETDIGRPISHIKARLSLDHLQANVREVMRNLGQVEHRVENPATGSLYIMRVLPYRSIDNFIGGTVVTFVDITALSRAETGRLRSEEDFRTVADLVPDLLWRSDADGRGQWFNRRWLDFTGQTMADAVGQGWLATLHPDDRPVLQQAFKAARQVELEQRVRSHEGGYRWFLLRLEPVHDQAGRVGQWFGAATDIDAQRRTLEALRDSERRSRALVEGIPQLVWRADPTGGWTWSSPQWLSFTGLSAEESLGHGWLAAVAPDDHERVNEAWHQATLTGALHCEHRICDAATQRLRWFATRATPLHDDAGRIVEWVGTSTDIDDLRRLQEHQRILLAELQHRVRNTLSIIRSIVRRSAPGSASIDDYATHLDGRLNAFARVQSAVARDPAAGIDLAGLIADELGAYAAREGSQVDIHGPAIRLQPKAAEVMALALHELATNALKHGALSTAAGHIAIGWHRADGKLVLDWKESGLPNPPVKTGHQGFGTELLERVLAYDLQAETASAYESDGLRWTISLPLTSRLAIPQDA